MNGLPRPWSPGTQAGVSAPWGLLLGLLLLFCTLLPLPGAPGADTQALFRARAALAGPVDWREVPASAEGRQWWDAGSLRRDRRGQLSVLSRFQPAGESAAQSSAARPPLGTLYVMELDCEQELYRDISVNGLPQWGAAWQPAAPDSLTIATLQAACAAAHSHA